MSKVTVHISMSLDGFITGPNEGVGNGMGDDGDRLQKTEADAAIRCHRENGMSWCTHWRCTYVRAFALSCAAAHISCGL